MGRKYLLTVQAQGNTVSLRRTRGFAGSAKIFAAGSPRAIDVPSKITSFVYFGLSNAPTVSMMNAILLNEKHTPPVLGGGALNIRIVERPPTWRGYAYSLAYILPGREPDSHELLELYRWAHNKMLPNPRVITPSTLQWSSLFNPRFFNAVTEGQRASEPRLSWTCLEDGFAELDLTRLWLESVLFLAGVTLSAAIIQSRYSPGTIASKYDRLWDAGVLADAGAIPELRDLDLCGAVYSLASDTELDDVERLLLIRRKFLSAMSVIAPVAGDLQKMTKSPLPRGYADRFGFVEQLVKTCGAGLRAVIAYGSSVSSESFADYDLMVVTDDPEVLLRKLAKQSPKWQSKEMNIGIYSPEELIVMQRLSGDNLNNYGLCLWGETSVVLKPTRRLLARNFSFGTVRQRQQLGMLSRALAEPITTEGDDLRNLYEYFVKIPANVAKGTFGALGEIWPKERVQEWMIEHFGFDSVSEQRRAVAGDPASPLASSALATGKVLAALNERVNLVKA